MATLAGTPAEPKVACQLQAAGEPLQEDLFCLAVTSNLHVQDTVSYRPSPKTLLG